MKIATTDIFSNVTEDLIKNAKIELEAEKIISKNNLRNERTGYLFESCYEYFLKNYRENMSVYKQSKRSGYDLIALYKGTVRVGSADFMTKKGKEMESVLPESEDWPVYQLSSLKTKVLTTLFSDPWDNRRSTELKPTAVKLWTILEKCLEV